MNDDIEFVTSPALFTMTKGLNVQRVTSEAAPPHLGNFGAVSVGPSHLPTVGAVMHVAIHDDKGETFMLTLGRGALKLFTEEMNKGIVDIMAGKFDTPEVSQ